jgi:O-antigen/teichoic acid export membrane protein
MLGASIALFATNQQLAAAAFLPVPLVLGVVLVLGPKFKRTMDAYYSGVDAVGQELLEVSENQEFIKVSGIGALVEQLFERANRQLTDRAKAFGFWAALYAPIFDFVAAAATALLVMSFAFWVAPGSISAETFLVFFVYLDKTSLFISVLISFVISYFLIVFATISVFIRTEKIAFGGIKSELVELIGQSRQNQLFGIANSMADSLDRFLIGLMLPLAFLAKYALITSIISFTRFFPDAYNRLMLLKHHQEQTKEKSQLGFVAYLLIGAAVVVLVFTSQQFIRIVFGDPWLLPLNVAMFFAVQEILRGLYQSKAVKLIAVGGSGDVAQASLFLITGAVLLMLIVIPLMGVVGAPASMVIVYAILNTALRYKLKAIN